MVPLLAVNAVKIKCSFENACITGNYECAYGLGVITSLAGIEPVMEFESVAALKAKVFQRIKNYEPESIKGKQLIKIISEYEPSAELNNQIKELYEIGLKEKVF